MEYQWLDLVSICVPVHADDLLLTAAMLYLRGFKSTLSVHSQVGEMIPQEMFSVKEEENMENG